MKKKLTGSQIRMLICLISAVIFALSYQYIYVKYEDKTDELKAKTKTAEQQLTQIKADLKEGETLKEKTEKINSRCEKMINSFPVNITKEDDLVFIDEMEKALKIDIPAVDIADTADFYTTTLPIRNEDGEEIITTGQDSTSASGTDITAADNSATATGTDTVAADASATTSGADTAADASATATGTDTAAADTSATASDTDTAAVDNSATATGTTTAPTDATADSTQESSQQYMKGLVSSISISFKTTADDFMKVVDYIEKYPEKTSMSDVTLTYDSSTGELMCSMKINRYALTGTGKVYKEPYIGDISIGTDNIFGTK